MSAIHLDASGVRLQLPVFRLGPLHGALLLHVEAAGVRATRRRDRRRRTAAPGYAAAVERIDAHRAAALAHRLPGF